MFGGGGGARPDRTEEILASHMDSDCIVYPMAERRASAAEVVSIGERLGVRFPAEYVDHLSGRFAGTYVEVKEEVWPRPRPLEVGPFWTFLYAVHSYTPVAESHDWMRLDLVGERFQAHTGLVAAPVLRVEGDPNVYCADDRGALWHYDHELNTLTPEEVDFWALYEREIAGLLARKRDRLARDGAAD